ncbi:MAG: type II secretion system protein GspM [Candidatus Binatus sp.]|uniref:type II secretion system protein GspM n=1 Tax=Candidatus Binatus sp. TaxID=2811406 RepID=UPI00271B493C|nr:type II secretion system protein GspM [Candidatus Binatus sp.]MDO8432964.1 type II secretion system protein GspM [Candidatus Binatus sp.]
MFRERLERLRARLIALIMPYLGQISRRIDPLLGQARGRYQKFEPRERLLVRIAAGLFGAFILYNVVYLPIVGIGAGLNDKIEQRQRDLSSIRRLAANYAALKGDLASAEHRTVPDNRDFSLFSVLEASLTSSLGHDKIASITPGSDRKLTDGFTEHSVQLKLQNVDLAQLVGALYAIGSMSQPVGISALRIQRRSENTHAYDVDLTCIALARNA